jgi:hypothetical protein
MILYDESGNVKFFSANAFKKILLDYDNFVMARESFSKNPEQYVQSYLDSIDKMRQIPEQFRREFISGLSLRDADLDRLEKNCMEYDSK